LLNVPSQLIACVAEVMFGTHDWAGTDERQNAGVGWEKALNEDLIQKRHQPMAACPSP